MNTTEHAQLRYTERIMNLKGKEAKRYAHKNKDMINKHLMKMCEHALFLWEGQLGSNKIRRFYLRDDIILIADEYDRCIITLYRADYGFTQSTNRQFVKELLEMVQKKKELLKGTINESQRRQITNEIEDACIKIINSIEYRMELEAVC